jgi:hypothetical protein
MATTIERPGVQVTQEFQTTSPTILVPALPACVVGPAVQVIEAVEDDGSLNADALLTTPGRAAFAYTAGVYTYTGIDISVRVNNGAVYVVSFTSDPTPTEAKAIFDDAEIPGLLTAVEESGGLTRLVLYTTNRGDTATLDLGSDADLTPPVITYPGTTGYVNYQGTRAHKVDYPDPRGNIDDVTVDYDTVRVFTNDGAGNIREALTTETFLDGAGTAVAVVDDGDGDNYSPYLSFANTEFAARNAQLVGTVDWTTLAYPAAFGVLTLEVYVDGVLDTVTFASPADADDAITQLNAALSPGATAVLNSSNQPVITSASSAITASIQIGTAGTINETTIGLAASRWGGPKPGFARAQGIVDLTGVDYVNDVQGRSLRILVDGQELSGVLGWQDIEFGSGVTDAATLVSAFVDELGVGAASVSLEGSGALVLVSTSSVGGVRIRGRESVIRIDKDASDATLLEAIGLTGVGAPFGTAGSTGTAAVWGSAYVPAAGDAVWVDGIEVGTVISVPASPTNRLRISAEQVLTFAGTSWSIVAKGLDNDLWTTTRPSSDLYVDEENGAIRIKHEMYRDSSGTPTLAGPLTTYLAYTGLRLDVSPATEDFNLLRIGSITDLEDQLSPVDTQNPLGLGMYFAILNAPALEVTGCGVSATSSTESEGTLDAYIEAFEFLESKDVYAIAPLTHSDDVGAVAQAHVDTMSLPANGLERLVLLNPTRPTRKSNTVVASGALGNVTGAGDTFNTGIANLQALLAAAGYPGPYNVGAALTVPVYLEMEDDTNKYPIESVSGGVVVINDGAFTSGNTDAFYYDAAGGNVFGSAVVDRPFSIKIRGAALANRTEEAIAYADIARSYLDRRVICTAPDHARATIDGLETLIDGYYLSAALAGKISAKEPQQPITEDRLIGFTGVVGSQDRYSESQLQILSGGGLMVFYQQADGQPVRCRHQLTTDMTTVERREMSITTALDFASKLLRTSLRTFIGRFNITTTVQDAITSVLEGLRSFLIRLGVFESFEVNAIRQSASSPDELEVDITVGVWYPLNKIRVTIKVV